MFRKIIRIFRDSQISLDSKAFGDEKDRGKRGVAFSNLGAIPNISAMNAPSCPHCGKPCKKAIHANTMTVLYDGYYKTCGKTVCVKKAIGSKNIFSSNTVGKKFEGYHPQSLANKRVALPYCYICKGPKLVRRQCCDACLEERKAKIHKRHHLIADRAVEIKTRRQEQLAEQLKKDVENFDRMIRMNKFEIPTGT